MIDNKQKTQKSAFTLAEVLITLGIIGTVAAMTIPTLIQNQTEQVTVSKLKKVYSMLSNAYLMAVSENGEPTAWGIEDDENATNSLANMNKFVPYLKIAKNCGTQSLGCFPAVTYKRLQGSNFTSTTGQIEAGSNHAKAILSDGTLISFRSSSCASCNETAGTTLALSNICSTVEVDINGPKEPNRAGYDYFVFYITKYGIVPRGSEHTDTDATTTGGCNQFESNGYGRGCAAWVIENENTDYLKCHNLSWTGNRSCN